ncbi:hypothetical protein D0A37_19140 [Microcoleus vaginatus HSN003]|nr:hypothetical protein D0A37_19140 [Microcoleus vaginatus HSN003]
MLFEYGCNGWCLTRCWRQESSVAWPTTRSKIPRGFNDVFAYRRLQEFSVKLAKMPKSKIELLAEQKTQTLGVSKLYHFRLNNWQ